MSNFHLDAEFLHYPETQKLAAALGENIIRFVGGCVRDALLGKPVTDIDIATTHAPEATIKLLEKAGIKAIPTGIEHGTVTAILGEKQFEITTLRRDVETDGRHATVAFTDDWQEDAARRDFTMNALYLSTHSELFDYFEGAADAKAGIVRFIGDAKQRITEDALRILRFFRFYAWYGKGVPDDDALQACNELASLVENLSGERIQKEMFKLLRAPNPLPALNQMQKLGVWQQTAPAEFDEKLFARLLEVEKKSNLKPCTKVRLAALITRVGQDNFLKTRWKCSGDMVETVQLIANVSLLKLDSASIKQNIRKYGARDTQRILVLQWAENANVQDVDYLEAIEITKSWQPPEFLVSGTDLIALGWKEGASLGQEIKRLEALWEESDYRLDKTKLLENAKTP